MSSLAPVLPSTNCSGRSDFFHVALAPHTMSTMNSVEGISFMHTRSECSHSRMPTRPKPYCYPSVAPTPHEQEETASLAHTSQDSCVCLLVIRRAHHSCRHPGMLRIHHPQGPIRRTQRNPNRMMMTMNEEEEDDDERGGRK
eukprot:2316560-Rhodomonas_salina.1